MNGLEQKELLLKLILENTQAQTHAIKDDKLEALETLITQREEVMSQVDELDKKMAITTSKGSKELLKQIITVDNSNQGLMKKGLQDVGKEVDLVKKELRKLRIGRQQGASYGEEYGIYREEGVF